MATDLAAKATRLRELHRGGKILVLPNAWDAASARIFEMAGFPALGTTSAGIAASLGYADGEQVGRREMLAVVARIARSVEIPVTADMESGYGPGVEDAEATARGIVEAGAVGLNFEDYQHHQMREMGAQVERIEAIRRVADEARVPIVINARIDVYLMQVGARETRVEETVRRGKAYLEAGADCIFVPGVYDRETIGELVRAIPGPLNILAVPETPPAAELERLGVARVSSGSGPMRGAMGFTRRMAEELMRRGTYGFAEEAIPYAEMNRMARG